LRAVAEVDAHDLAGFLAQHIDKAVVARRAGQKDGALPDIRDERRLDRAGIGVARPEPIKGVVTLASVDPVRPVAAGQEVGAAEPGDMIGAAAAGDRVGIAAAGKRLAGIRACDVGQTGTSSLRQQQAAAAAVSAPPTWRARREEGRVEIAPVSAKKREPAGLQQEVSCRQRIDA
jgi:hypothetical protein